MDEGPAARVLLVAGGATGERAARRLRAADGIEVHARVSEAEAAPRATEGAPIDCVVVGSDLPDAAATTVVERHADRPVVALRPPESGPSRAALFDAGAADVVPADGSTRFERLPGRIAALVAWNRRRESIEGRLTEALKERAIDEAPVGITIADNTLPDQPLVYVNDAFVAMTGYSKPEALGRNCRYLQGPRTDSEAVATLREAIRAGESASVELLNYRRDGSTFWNRVDVAPIEQNGEITHYVGFQSDITERVRAETAAERFADEADRERTRLRGLLDHIEGLLRDGSRALVQAENRAELERRICECVAASEAFQCAWIGDCDLSRESIVPKTWAGTDGPEIVGLRIDRRDPDDPVSRAASTRQTQAVTDPEGRFHADGVVQFGGMVAVPIVHRGTLFGVLAAYGDGSVTDVHEQAVLGTLGRAAGAAIDGFESRRSLLTETRLEMFLEATAPESPLVAVAERAGCALKYEGSLARDDGSVLLFVSTSASDIALDDPVPGIERLRTVRSGDEGAVHEVALEPGSLLTLVAEAGGRLDGLTATATGRTVELAVLVPDRASGRSLIDDLEAVTRSVRLTALREREEAQLSEREFVATVERELTDRQQTALQLAHVSGFYEWPHAVSGDELADAMGVSRATFHQHLRAAERKLVARFFRGGGA